MANPIEVSALGATNALATYEARNFVGSDDVSVKGYTGCVTAATIEGGKIKYSVNPNYGTGSIAGTITLQSAEASDKVVNVTQTGDTFSQTGASGSPLVLTIPADAPTATINITSRVFGWNASVTPATGKSLSIKTGESTFVSATSGSKNDSAQTITVSSTESAPTSGDPLTLGTFDVYRNGNTSDTQKISVTIKKAVSGTPTTASVDDVLFLETWGSYTGAVGDYTFTGTTTWDGTTTGLSYTSDNESSLCDATAAGSITDNNFFFYKKGTSSLTMEGIALHGATGLTLEFVTNGTNLNVYYTIDDGEEQTLLTGCVKGANEETISSISGDSITLRFYKTGTSANNRIDDIQLTVSSVD